MAAANPAIITYTAWRPKDGHSEDKYEDAFAVTQPGLPFRAAIADGATESAFSGGWARALTEGFVRGRIDSASHYELEDGSCLLRPVIQQARSRWRPEPDRRWYVAAKAAEGAHAAVLGLEIVEAGWRAEAVGDCCLFHVRDRRLLRSWPMTSPEAFSHRPPLVSSRDANSGSSPAAAADLEIEANSGVWHPGDAFILGTDAIAQWLLRQESFPTLGDSPKAKHLEAKLDTLVSRAASSGMRNDDATLVAVVIGS